MTISHMGISAPNGFYVPWKFIYLRTLDSVPDPGKGVCADPVNGGAILGKGGPYPRREQGASVEPR